MKGMKSLLLAIVCALAITVFLLIGFAAFFAAVYDKNVRWFAFFASVCSFVGTILVFISFFKCLNYLDEKEKTKTKPVVQLWTHNGETVVTSNEGYRLGLGMRDQLRIIYPWISSSFRVRPLIYSVQSEKRVGAITAPQLQAIKDSCSVSVSEMQIPNEGNIGHVVDFAQIWKLIHGADAEPPKV